jgi:REP element-mobilizing transposase RayT
MPSKTISQTIKPGFVYHIYNRAINNEKLFYQEEDKELFMWILNRFLSSKIELYAYCLIPNHYHLLLRVNEEITQQEFCNAIGSVFKSFTNRYNMKYNRRGALFQGRYRRREVKELSCFRKVLIYIHLNPLRHGVSDHPAAYPYSSYMHYLTQRKDILNLQPALEAFDSLPNLVFVHEVAVKKFRDSLP